MNKIVFGIGIVLAVLAVLTAPAAAQDYNVFHLVPEDSSCNPGEDVIVWVKVNTSYSDINAVQVSIIFDPSVVNVTLVEKGTPDWGDMWGWTIFNLHGYTYVKISGAKPTATFGPGELDIGKMTLHCEAGGISSLHFADESEVTAEDMTSIGNASGPIWPITTEDGTFSCGVTPETFSKDLVAGWNLVSLPLTPLVDNSASAVLSSMSGKYDAVYSYDVVTNDFVDVSDGTMDPRIGYFVHVTTAGTWTYNGVAKTSMNVPLEQGLNMVGWHNCTKTIGTESGDALYSIKDSYYYAARWNAGTQEFETYNPVAPNGFNDFADMERGEGYFISAKGVDTLSESC